MKRTGDTTQHGEGRYIIKLRKDGNDFKMFTDSSRLKNVLDQVKKEGFPFLTTIVKIRFSGGKKTYQFT